MNLPAALIPARESQRRDGCALLWQALLGIALLGIFSSTIFLLMVLIAAMRWRRGARAARQAAAATPESSLPAVTIFKPVHGMEARLEENLESFFQQDYPAFEIVLGARDANDAGLQLAEKIRQRYPQVRSRIVVSGPPTWPNAKVFSLSKMIPGSTNDYFVISDSDVRVSPDFLRNVIPALLDPTIGLVTCPYRGVTAGDFWSTLEALGMSVEMPSGVMVADMLEGIRFALGPAVALRRDALDKIGGIAATADYYSDDFVLGNLIWAAGYKVIFSHHIIQHVLTPRSLKRTLGDQLRWMKSTRFSRPLGPCRDGSYLCHAVRSSWPDRSSRNGTLGAGSRTLRGCLRKPGRTIDRRRMGNHRRPARFVSRRGSIPCVICWASSSGWPASAAALFSGAEKPTASAKAEESFRKTGPRRARSERSCRNRGAARVGFAEGHEFTRAV